MKEGVIQVLDNLKLSETEPHFALRQQRLQQLFKRKTIRWSELEATSRWLENRKILTALQQRWLDNKANKH